jgi:hypothetical protein
MTHTARLEDISPEETTAISGPILVRAFIIDVLVKHGSMTREAGGKLGYASLMPMVNESWPKPRDAS